METLRNRFLGSSYILDDKLVDSITFFNKDGILITEQRGCLTRTNLGGSVSSLSVLNILRCVGFRSEEKRQKFIEKQINKDEPVNFAIHKGGKNGMFDLFLYVDNEYIKMLAYSDYDQPSVHEATLTKEIMKMRKCAFKICNESVEVTQYMGVVPVDTSEIQKQALELFDKIYEVAYIQKDRFFEIFNLCEIKLRDKPLL